MEKSRRTWEETWFPARGERATPFLRMIPSCTGVIETLDAPTSTTKAEGLPAENLKSDLGQGLGGVVLWLVQLTPPTPHSERASRQDNPSFPLRFQSLFPDFSLRSSRAQS